jgi:preprotein translocase subunit SecG
MATLISVLIVIVSLLLIVVVLIQNSKGGGISSSFGAPNQMMGVKKTAETVEKITWGLAVALVFLSIVSASFNKPQGKSTPTESVTRQKATEAAPVEAPLNNGIPNIPIQQAPEGN